jgi:hypothetical protein
MSTDPRTHAARVLTQIAPNLRADRLAMIVGICEARWPAFLDDVAFDATQLRRLELALRRHRDVLRPCAAGSRLARSAAEIIDALLAFEPLEGVPS